MQEDNDSGWENEPQEPNTGNEPQEPNTVGDCDSMPTQYIPEEGDFIDILPPGLDLPAANDSVIIAPEKWKNPWDVPKGK